MVPDENQGTTDAKITNLQQGLNDTNSNTMTNHDVLKHLHGIGNILVDLNHKIPASQQETSREITLSKDSLLCEINKIIEKLNNVDKRIDRSALRMIMWITGIFVTCFGGAVYVLQLLNKSI